ncbi:general amidase [Wolfiporia cocos MD-104 SS10]|uniref:amidase n=1 Tax=Wolfiporia cocos (strain MD-104) TaxID=742152 RepID=A0A2H3J2F4_WOLCO|nr:general amidase [Wolfiporia cocos MD-104 SS10]
MEKWQSLVADKRRRQQNAIPSAWLIAEPPKTVANVTSFPSECGLLTEKEVLITETVDINILLRKIAASEWSSVEVVTAFYKRAVIAHQLVNCLTEIDIPRAIARAAELDEYLRTHGKVVGPLHGLPVSLKDQISVKGLETTMGYASWVGQYAECDATIVEILYECGAVPFVKTNLPQTLLWIETNNLLFGRTVNPVNRNLTSGGSSGGEGALLALKGSPLGIGTDLGGSLRIPTAYNGLYGLKPSALRMPLSGVVSSIQGQDSVLSSLGPMANTLSGLKAFMEAIFSQEPWMKDPLVAPMPWSKARYELAEHGGGNRLCFAIMWHDGAIKPHPPVTRALTLVKDALTIAGHQVIDWQPLKHLEFSNLLNSIWSAGSREDFLEATMSTGEPILDSMELNAGTSGAGYFAKTTGTGAHELWKLHKLKTETRKDYLDRWQNTVQVTGTGRPIDAIICPATPSAAPPHGMNKYSNYTRVWNALDYTASVFPVTTVNPDVDIKQPPHEFSNSLDKFYYEMYELETFRGAPIGLQLVGRMLEEEAVLAMTKIVDDALKVVPTHKL